MHKKTFSLKTGGCLTGEPYSIQTFPVKVEGDDVMILLPPPGERDKLDLNKADLIRAATDSHGQYYSIATAEQLLDDLPEAARLPLNSPSPPVQLWNHLFTFVLVLLLFGLEWVLRKRVRLL